MHAHAAPLQGPQGPDFKSIFESVPGLYLVLLPDAPRYTIVAVSQAYASATKTVREQIVGRGIFQVFPDNPDDPNATGERNLRASLDRVLAQREPDAMAVQKYDIPRPAAEGGGFEGRYWSPLNTPVVAEAGALRYIVHRVEDVTEFMRMKLRGEEQARLTQELQGRADRMAAEVYQRAQELQQANERLREANVQLGQVDKIKTEFFSNVSHEFRTPLTLLLGPLEALLSEHALASPARQAVEQMQRNALRLLRLVNALLDFSRMEAGRYSARFAATDLMRFTADLASAFATAMDKAGLRFEVDCRSLPEPVWVDRAMWEKVVLNLLSNALKFTFAGSVRLSLGPAPGGGAVLSVKDTGVGIPAAELPSMFQRFHRVQGTPSRSQEGTGIGLALVQQVVRLHGGEIAVDSVQGQGSCFTVTLPSGNAHLPPEHVVADAHVPLGGGGLLRVLLQNLLDNAWKYSGPVLQAVITVRRREPGETQDKGQGNGPVYVVHDNGVGFDMDYAEKLFRPFQRLHSEREFPGTGIGLATVRRVVERHGGQ
ncbi:MAG TPA: ATP-binding protein, partial [Ramlibacter sp.]|nr:ATP-binding protein [Ramlibacter sp.]